jgi:starch synthase
MADLKVLFATSEMAPLIKTGGLADVSAALPVALRAMGVDVRVLLPGYASVLSKLGDMSESATLTLPGFPETRLLSTTTPLGVPLLVLDCPPL